MKKSKKILNLEHKVAQMEIQLELLQLSLENIMQEQGMIIESNLDSGKWYPSIDTKA